MGRPLNLMTRSWRRKAADRLRSASGAIDLASIMVGVLVIGIVGGTVSATVFGVIPWSQDEAAKQNVAAIGEAESVVRVETNGFETHTKLIEYKRLQASPGIRALTNADRDCYVAIAKSAAGPLFFATDKKPEAVKVETTSAQDCVPASEFEDALEELDGEVTAPAPEVPAIPAPVISTSALPAGTTGDLYSATVVFTGTDAKIAVTGGTLPDGLTLNETTGAIVGVPTTVADVTFTVTVTSGAQTTTQEFTVSVAAGELEFTTVASGTWHSLALDSTGHLWAWGNNEQGQLGDGTVTQRSAPTKITPSVTYKEVAASNMTSYAITSAGHLVSWGYNGWGQLGNGTQGGADQLAPTRVIVGTTFSEIAASSTEARAIDASGLLWAWGSDYSNEWTDSTNVVVTPAVVMPAMRFSDVSVGISHSLALTTAGKLYTWGGNTQGQLGDGTTTKSAAMKAITPAVNYSAIDSGFRHSIALTAAGKLYTWGQNSRGQIGDGSTTNALVPTAVATGQTFKDVAAAGDASAAVTTDGRVYSWGYNNSGQFGDGTTTSSLLPKAGFTDVVASAVELGSSGSTTTAFVIDADGHIWASGYAGGGSLGDGTTTAKLTPTRITVR